jgi:hypothetical protein
MDKQIKKLHQIQMYGRWLFVLLCWLILAPLGIWGLREEISLILEHFTWAAIIYGISYNFLPSLAITFCFAITLAVLIRHSKYYLTGISPREKLQLEKKVRQINNLGAKHFLWKFISNPK